MRNSSKRGSTSTRSLRFLARYKSFFARGEVNRAEPSKARRSRDLENMPYYVYILECTNKTLYTGITNNLERRLKEHQTGRGGHYTSYNPGIRIRYFEEYPTRSLAAKREAQIKRWSRTKKLALIKGDKWVLKAGARCKNK